MSEQFLDYLKYAEDLAIHLVPGILILVIGRLVLGLIIRAANAAMEKAHVDPTLSLFIERVVYFAGMLFVGLIAVSKLGIDTTPMVAALGAAGFAAALAFKDSLANLSAGGMLIMFRPFKVGDFVEVAGQMGKVQRIDIFSTQLLSPDNKWTTIPNGKITSANITNFTRMPTRRVDMVVGVSYGDDLQLAKQVMIDLLAENEHVLPEPAPVVAVSELGDSSIDFIVRPWVRSEHVWVTKWWFLEHIPARLAAAGITIPFNQYDVHLHQSTKADDRR